jgi:hypothetical protein
MRPQGDGIALRQHLIAVERNANLRQERLHRPRPELAYLWDWFMDLSKGRTGNGFGANPLPWTEVQAWCALTRTTLSRVEVRALRLLDGLFLSVINKKG